MVSFENLNRSSQDENPLEKLDEDSADIIINQQHTEAIVINSQIDAYKSEINRITTQGYETSLGNEIIVHRLEGLEVELSMAKNLGSEEDIKKLENEMLHLRKDSREFSEIKVDIAIKEFSSAISVLSTMWGLQTWFTL